jgi:hypothetical protein
LRFSTVEELLPGGMSDVLDRAREQCGGIHMDMDVEPHAHVLHCRDALATAVHHFDIPGPHRQVVIRAEALLELRRHLRRPDAVPPDARRVHGQRAQHHRGGSAGGDLPRFDPRDRPSPLLPPSAAGPPLQTQSQ